MLVGIHSFKSNESKQRLIIYEKILEFNKINYIHLNINDFDFWQNVKKLDLFIYIMQDPTDYKELLKSILPVIQNYLKVKCYPNISTAWHFDDKVKEYYLLKQTGLPVINSFIFWDKQKALNWSKNTNYPIVFKLKTGSASDGVILVKNLRTARSLINRMFGRGVQPTRDLFSSSVQIKDFKIKDYFRRTASKINSYFKGEDIYPIWQKEKNYVLFQEFLDNNTYDIRIMVIGNRAFAFTRYNRDNDFRASGSGKVDFDPSLIDMRCVQIAFNASEKLKFQSMAFDFIYNEYKEPVICEMSFTYPPKKGGYDLPGYWDRDLNWHQGHFWPQYFHLMDCLNLPNLKQPESIHF